jgi:hypothetical protein
MTDGRLVKIIEGILPAPDDEVTVFKSNRVDF